MDHKRRFTTTEFTQQLAQAHRIEPVFKQRLHTAQAELRAAFYAKQPIIDILKARAQLLDELLTHAWEVLQLPSEDDNLCLIATGGYGREELHPYSDIDILILVDADSLKKWQTRLSQFITLLWDIGLKVGHNVGTAAELLQVMEQNISTATCLLDNRLVLGNVTCFKRLQRAIRQHGYWSRQRFYQAKLLELEERHKKYGNSSYNLEPNVKEGPGGLRDIQTVYWIAKKSFAIKELHDLVWRGFISEEEFATLQDTHDYLSALRTALHHLTERQEERLLFDYQIQLAKQFGYADKNTNLAVEQFMQRFYRHVKELNELTDMLAQLYEAFFLTSAEPTAVIELNERFQIRNHYIEVAHEDVFKNTPSALIEIFLLMAKNPEITGVGASTIRLLHQHREFINDKFRDDRQIKKMFIDVFAQPGDVAKYLRMMNRYGILGKYLPIFGNLIGQMQYDLYHVFTVDKHLIVTLQNMYDFTRTESAETFPLCHEIMQNIPDRRLLYLSGLLHDIGKGQGGNHSLIGAAYARTFCQSHGLSESDTELVAWLVEHHLLLSYTAQRTDIYDPENIQKFADKIASVTKLNYLYLLTCADIYATNASLWNNWRASLLRDLFTASREYLQDKKNRKMETHAFIGKVKQQAKQLLAEHDPEVIDALWSQWQKPYFLHHSVEKIAWHTRAILQHKHLDEPLILISPYLNQGGTEIFIYFKDQDYIFANTTAVLDKLQLNIVEAQIITTGNGFTLDSYIVIDKDDKMVTDADMIAMVKQRLLHALQNLVKPTRFAKRRLTRRQKHFSSPTEISFALDSHQRHTLLTISTPDRAGLLARIGTAFKECHVAVHHAKITTLGDRVEDVFFITQQNGAVIDDEATQNKLNKTLHRYLDSMTKADGKVKTQKEG